MQFVAGSLEEVSAFLRAEEIADFTDGLTDGFEASGSVLSEQGLEL